MINMSPKKHRSRLPRSGNSNEKESSRPSSRGASAHGKNVAQRSGEDLLVSNNVSSLSGDAIRWIRRRKKATGIDSVAAQVLPSKAKKLKGIFDSLDPENTGTVSVKTMKAALKYVNNVSSSFLSIAPEASQSTTNSASLSQSFSQSRSQSQSFSLPSQYPPRDSSQNRNTNSASIPVATSKPSHPGDILVAVGGTRIPFQANASPPSSPPLSGGKGRVPTQDSTQESSPDRSGKDSKALLNFFTSMDTNHDGVINFKDFLAAMAVESNEQVQSSEPVNPQDEFVDFATKHKRHKIIECTKDPTKTDLEKYEELKKLFQLSYYSTGTIDLSVHDKLARVKSELESHLKELRSESYVQSKRKELLRAREATLFFAAQQKKSQEISDHQQKVRKARHASVSNRPTTPIATASGHDYSATEAAERQIRKRFAQFALHSEHTYTPKVEEVSKTANSTYFKSLAKEEVYKLRNDKYLVRNLPPILPPISMKDKLITGAVGTRTKQSFSNSQRLSSASLLLGHQS